MEEQKYYTPAPEDLRIGFEMHHLYRGEWHKARIKELSDASFYESLINGMDHVLRVPYLTAEQIEAEGWTKCNDQMDFSFGDRDEEHYTLHYSTAYNDAVINRHSFDEYTSSMRKQLLYFGKCRCINDLRLISKLIGI